MTSKQENKFKFYQGIGYLIECSDTVIKNEHGEVVERGISIQSNDYITYHLKDNTIKFYVNNEEVLVIGENSPLISMFEGLILSMNEE